MAEITIQVTDSEKTFLQYMADFYGMSLSDLIKKYSMDQLEDEYDSQIAQVTYKKFLEDNQETISMHEILDKF
ncbi:type II toxin-antitoxin system RelB family antitoxin [Companilactobacillus farciminis]|uniref:type II toxin-antitoxin system RelB family antitoxin n=1 Tax=Companilactobacillus farciminis TaxID=1612 RepID=UPI0019162E46|nr:DUF6290 family protein [Companilactobacillus farciminis]